MPILTPQPVDDQAQKNFALTNFPNRVKALAREQLQLLTQKQNQGIEIFWGHPVLTPQEAANSLGTNAGEVFTAHGMLTQMIVQLATLLGTEPKIILPPNAFTINPDGTVTILDTPYQP